MVVDNLLKKVQTECLLAFCHSRVAGIAGMDQVGEAVFKKQQVEKITVETGIELQEILKDVSTIETINKKIENKNNIGLANMYYYHYNKLLNLLDKEILKDGKMVEGIIGLHLLSLSCDLGIINSDNKESFDYMIDLYESDENVKDKDTLDVILNMRKVSKNIFTKYWEKPKKIKRKKN